MKLTKNQEGILLHTLGYDYAPVPFRNYFNAEPGHDDMLDILSLVSLGLMHVSGSINKPGDMFSCTPLGKTLAANLYEEKRPKLTSSQKRYMIFRKIADVYPDLTFGEFLKRRLYAQN